MFFNKPIYVPNSLSIESPISGNSGIDIAIDVIIQIKDLVDVVVVCLIKGICCEGGKEIVIEKEDYSIYKIANKENNNLSSKLINAGAKDVFSIMLEKGEYKAALSNLFDIIGSDKTIICISKDINNIIRSSLTVVPNIKDKKLLIDKNKNLEEYSIYTLSEFVKRKFEYKSNKINLLDL